MKFKIGDRVKLVNAKRKENNGVIGDIVKIYYSRFSKLKIIQIEVTDNKSSSLGYKVGMMASFQMSKMKHLYNWIEL